MLNKEFLKLCGFVPTLENENEVGYIHESKTGYLPIVLVVRQYGETTFINLVNEYAGCRNEIKLYDPTIEQFDFALKALKINVPIKSLS